MRILVVLVCCGMILAPAHRVSADDESEALLKYKEPIDVSVDKALDYLSQQQAENGSFPGQYGQTTAMAALAGMAFLSKGPIVFPPCSCPRCRGWSILSGRRRLMTSCREHWR